MIEGSTAVQGLPPAAVPVRGGPRREMYGDLSEAAHHRRRWVQDAVFAAEPTMLVGPADHRVRRAAGVARVVGVVEEAAISVGGALVELVPDRSCYTREVKPSIEGCARLRESEPLI